MPLPFHQPSRSENELQQNRCRAYGHLELIAENNPVKPPIVKSPIKPVHTALVSLIEPSPLHRECPVENFNADAATRKSKMKIPYQRKLIVQKQTYDVPKLKAQYGYGQRRKSDEGISKNTSS